MRYSAFVVVALVVGACGQASKNDPASSSATGGTAGSSSGSGNSGGTAGSATAGANSAGTTEAGTNGAGTGGVGGNFVIGGGTGGAVAGTTGEAGAAEGGAAPSTACPDGCYIAGECVAEGVQHGACGECNPARDPEGWSALFGFCRIADECYQEGQVNPQNPCEVCDQSESTTTWGSNEGQECGAGNACREAATCVAGECVAGAALNDEFEPNDTVEQATLRAGGCGLAMVDNATLSGGDTDWFRIEGADTDSCKYERMFLRRPLSNAYAAEFCFYLKCLEGENPSLACPGFGNPDSDLAGYIGCCYDRTLPNAAAMEMEVNGLVCPGGGTADMLIKMQQKTSGGPCETYDLTAISY